MSRSTFFTKVATLATILIITLSSVPEAYAALANDNFADAAVISSLPFASDVDLAQASVEAGEPVRSCSIHPLYASAWYTFTPTTSQTLTASALTGDIEDVIAVFTGDSLNNLTEVACGEITLTFQAEANVTYSIQISNTLAPDIATFRLDVTPPPSAGVQYSPLDPSVFDDIQFCDYSKDSWSNNNFQSFTWVFGDGTTATGECVLHRYQADGGYTLQHAVTTVDGRTDTISLLIAVRTHDVAITKVSAPNSANVGQTKPIIVSIYNKRASETIQVYLYKSDPLGQDGYSFVGSYTGPAPLLSGNRTTDITFNYTFSSTDAKYGKVTFKAVVLLVKTRDAFPADNTWISSATKVNK